MNPTSREQIVFAEALRCAAPQARATCLDAACGSDQALRQRVEALLRAADNAGDFLEQAPTGLSGEAAAALWESNLFPLVPPETLRVTDQKTVVSDPALPLIS